MYEDAGVSQYYHPSLLSNYMRRYVMFVAIIGVLGAGVDRDPAGGAADGVGVRQIGPISETGGRG